MSSWTATMPANIALIKYMGKQPGQIPTNPSLSITVPRFTSTVTLTTAHSDHWDTQDWSEPAKSRFLNHLKWLKKTTDCNQCFSISSHNHFPDTCGLASSASSFAALTHAFFLATQPQMPLEEQASYSRMGSGSSCRSFLSPLALWDNTDVSAINSPIQWRHKVIVINASKKKVSSSEAHQRVTTSPLFLNRAQRAKDRLNQLITALEHNHWEQLFLICWDEFQDMHDLFKTATPPFQYIEEATEQALKICQQFWHLHGTGPMVTLDAGPNIHLFFQCETTEKKCLDALKGFTLL